MDKIDKTWIISRYNKRLEKYGASNAAIATSELKERKDIRFKVLCEVGIKPRDRVLDLGCGLGDFYGYCRSNGLDIEYIGIDINPNLIAVAKERYPGLDFRVCDIQQENLGSFDYIVSSECFNTKLQTEDNYLFIKDIMRRCYKLAKKGVAIDFLTDYVDFRGVEEAFYYSPQYIFGIAKEMTKRVCLRHDYPIFQFCIYLYPDFKGWSKE